MRPSNGRSRKSSNLVALLIVDMQEGFFEPPRLRRARRRLTRRVNEALDVARNLGWAVIWIRSAFRADLSDAPRDMRRPGRSPLIVGSPRAQLLEEFVSHPTDWTVIKKRYSAFFGTGLDRRLRRAGVEATIVCGVNTHSCVRMTAVDAYQHDYVVHLLRGGVDSYDRAHHEVSLHYLRGRIATVSSPASIANHATGSGP
jgi:nicotinamidase-related amidase